MLDVVEPAVLDRICPCLAHRRTVVAVGRLHPALAQDFLPRQAGQSKPAFVDVDGASLRVGSPGHLRVKRDGALQMRLAFCKLRTQ